MEAYKKIIEYLRSKSDKITIIDIGCARSAFINEFLIKYFERNLIKSIGIDPLQHEGSFNAEKNYTFYIKGCVDNIEKGCINKSKFYLNSIDQASSLLKINTKNFSSNLNDYENKFYYPQDIIERLNKIENIIEVNVYNLEDIIDKYLDKDEIIDFIKIDAEGKDLEIVKSIKSYLYKIKFIAVECSSHSQKDLAIFVNGSTINDCIEYFECNNFSIYDLTDYSTKEDNLTQMSDVVFINNNFIL